MRARQREAGFGVIELRARPAYRAVADRTIRGEPRRGVIRIRGLSIVGKVARGAVARRPREDSLDVALRARETHMRSREREVGKAAVVERHTRPITGVMAQSAILRETRLGVVGIARAREILKMAADATGAGQLEIAAEMAGGAIELGVNAGQGETSELPVVEGSPHPGIHGVAGLASRGEARRLMIGKLRLHELGRVAGHAIGGQSLELPSRRSLMAIVADQSGVRSDQGKAVLVTADARQNNLPAAHRVAALAVRSELPPVDVRMTVGTLGPRVRKHQAHMALGAGDPFMHASQGIARFIVVELQNIPQGLPGSKCVAILTGDLEIPVRTAGRLRRHLPACLGSGRSQHEGKTQKRCLASSSAHWFLKPGVW